MRGAEAPTRSTWVSTSHVASELRTKTDTYIDFRGQKNMKRYVLMGLATLAAACGSSSPSSPSGQPNTVVFTAALSAANETPPITNVDKDAKGNASITFHLTRDNAGVI